MLKLPGHLTAESFLRQHWQQRPLFMPAALRRVRPSISRNELAWLATLEDVESRLVFADNDHRRRRYEVENGPFDPAYLKSLPKKNWTLLVHDVEKHLPAMRALFRHIPFIPDWRIDDVMVSFAAPGGGVGPHKDHYDVFLFQGIGMRNWQFTRQTVDADPDASDTLSLLAEFEGDEDHDTVEGDVLYLPPGVAHWGRAIRACMTYSVGMRAPQARDLSPVTEHAAPEQNVFYTDTDLGADEAVTGYISAESANRVLTLLGASAADKLAAAESLGRFSTETKAWLRPDAATPAEAEHLLERLKTGRTLKINGMAQLAFDDHRFYVNGRSTQRGSGSSAFFREICSRRRLSLATPLTDDDAALLVWMARSGAFELPDGPRPYVK